MDRRTPADGSATPPMTMERLIELLDAYGARSEQWPFGERAAALALLRHSAEARARRDEAARLDTVLDQAVAPAASPELLARVLATAPSSRPAAGPERRDRTHDRPGPSEPLLPARGRRLPGRRWRVAAATSLAAAGVSLAAAAAVMLWLARAPEVSEQAGAAPALAMLDTYDAPTDALLESDSLDLTDALPALGCRDGEWGCPELDAVEERSSTVPTRRIHA